VKDWEIIADNLSKAGFSLGWVSALDVEGRIIWIVDAHRDGKRFIVRSDEKLTAFWKWNLRSVLEASEKRTCHHSRYHRKRSHLLNEAHAKQGVKQNEPTISLSLCGRPLKEPRRHTNRHTNSASKKGL
jgi:hypothetical protein